MINLPPVTPSTWLGDGLAGLLAVFAVTWLGYCIKQFRDVPGEWEQWIEIYFTSQVTRQGKLLEVVYMNTLRPAISAYFELRPARELPADPQVLREAAAEIEKDAASGPQRARDLIYLPLVGRFQDQLLEALPTIAQQLPMLPEVVEALLTLGCYGGDLDKERRRQGLVRAGYLLTGACCIVWGLVIVLTRAYDWTPLALLAPAAVGGTMTIAVEGLRERARIRLHVLKNLAEIISA